MGPPGSIWELLRSPSHRRSGQASGHRNSQRHCSISPSRLPIHSDGLSSSGCTGRLLLHSSGKGKPSPLSTLADLSGSTGDSDTDSASSKPLSRASLPGSDSDTASEPDLPKVLTPNSLDPVLSVPLPTSAAERPSAHSQHISAAHTAAKSLLSPPLPPPRLLRCIETVASLSPQALSSARQSSLVELRAASELLVGRSAELLHAAPRHCQQVLKAAGSGPNLGLIEHLLRKLDWHDRSLLRDLSEGFPLVGDIPVCLDAPPGTRRIASLSEQELWERGTSSISAQLSRQNRPLASGSAAQEDAAELWRQTQLELELRRIEVVAPSSPWEGPLTRRFAVRQLTSDGRSKVRGIDDFHESLVNDCCSVRRRLRMGRLSDLHFTASRLRAARPLDKLSLLKSDFKAAYRGCPISAGHLKLAVILAQEPLPSGGAQTHRLQQLAMPFGAVGAVYAWDRLGAFLTAVLTDLFYIPASRYVDDLFLIDYSECADEARAIMLEVVNLLGFTLEEAKTPPPSFTQDILGVKVEITDSELLLTPEPRKVALWIQMINIALDKSSLGLADAMKLAGRLNFAASATWGQVARSRLRRLYGHIVNGNTDFGRPLASDLTWWLSRLERLEPQRLALFIDDPVVIYTDAEGNGGLGGVISDSATAAWFSSPTPQELLAALIPRKTQIFPLEVLAVAVALKLWRHRLQGRHIIVFVDNTGALAALRKGSSRAPDVHGLITLIWDIIVDSFSSIKFFWVPSKLNLSDLPSRGLTPILGSRDQVRIRWELFCSALHRR